MTNAQIFRTGALLICAAVVGVAIWKWNDWRAAAYAGSAYAARITCSCRYVEGRSAESCAQDVALDARVVMVGEDNVKKRISGRIPLLGSASAIYRPGFGCLMEPD